MTNQTDKWLSVKEIIAQDKTEPEEVTITLSLDQCKWLADLIDKSVYVDTLNVLPILNSRLK